jgi:hypothetical protein
MKRPRVVLHCLVSLDGKLEGFGVDAGLYYELSARIPHEAVLCGSGTIVAAARHSGVDLRAADAGDTRASADPERPILAVVDSSGRVTRFDWLHAGGTGERCSCSARARRRRSISSGCAAGASRTMSSARIASIWPGRWPCSATATW